MKSRILTCILQSLLAATALMSAVVSAQISTTLPAPPPDTVIVAPAPEPLPPGAAPPSLMRKVESRFSGFVGGKENADNLAVGLRNGTDITLYEYDRLGNKVPLTFTPATGHLGVGNVMHSLNLASRMLVSEGVYSPTPEQLAAALNGGTIRVPGSVPGTTRVVEFRGVLQMRADGMGWGEISKELGVKHSGGPGPSSAPFVPAQQAKFIERKDHRRNDRILPAASVTTEAGPRAASDLRREDRRMDRREDKAADRRDDRVDTANRGRSDIENAGRPDKGGERIAAADRPTRAERPGRPERVDRPDRPEPPQRPERPERPEKPAKPERPEKPERGGKH